MKGMARARFFRREEFTEDQYKNLKWDLVKYAEGAFYVSDGKLELNSTEKTQLSKIFNWLVGNGIDINLNKGLLFTGDYGTGKSVMLKAIVRFINEKYSDKAISNGIPEPMYILAQDMANKFKNNDEYTINRMKTTPVLAIDDIGYEEREVSYFGTICRPLEEIIMARYDRRRLVLISTNMSLQQIGERYGEHIKDRIKQMVYIMEFKGKSFRK